METELYIYQFLNSLENGGWSVPRPAVLQPGKKYDTICTGKMTQHLNQI